MFKILVIDDSKAVHAFVKDCLKGMSGVQLTASFSAPEALKLIEAKNLFDLVLLDWEMPEMNGPEAYEKLKLIKFKTPVVMMTSRNEMADIQQMIQAGVSEYVIKPFTKDILISKINFAVGLDINYVS